MTIVLVLQKGPSPCSVVRYSDGGDALEHIDNLSVRGAFSLAANLTELYSGCTLEIAVRYGGRVVHTFADAQD